MRLSSNAAFLEKAFKHHSRLLVYKACPDCLLLCKTSMLALYLIAGSHIAIHEPIMHHKKSVVLLPDQPTSSFVLNIKEKKNPLLRCYKEGVLTYIQVHLPATSPYKHEPSAYQS